MNKLCGLLIIMVTMMGCRRQAESDTESLDFFQDSATNNRFGFAGRLDIPPHVFLAHKLLKQNLPDDGYLRFYIHDEFANYVLNDDASVGFNDTISDQQQAWCVDPKRVDKPMCNYRDSHGGQVDLVGWTKAAIVLWSQAVYDYLEHVVIPIYKNRGNTDVINGALLQKIVAVRDIKQTTNWRKADLIIWIPWGTPGTAGTDFREGVPVYRDREAGLDCHMYYSDTFFIRDHLLAGVDETAKNAVLADLDGFQVPYLHLPLNNPDLLYGNTCFDFPVMMHEMGHVFGIADSYAYSETTAMGGQPTNTLMRDLNLFSMNFVPKADDQLAVTTLFIHRMLWDAANNKAQATLTTFIDESGCLRHVSDPITSAGSFGCTEKKWIRNQIQ